MTNGLFQRKCKGFPSVRKLTDNLPRPAPLKFGLLISAIRARAPLKTCRSSGQGWGGHWFSTSLQFVASLKSSCCLWSELFWANEYQRIGWDFGCRQAAANSLHRGDSAGRRLARRRFSCSTSHFSLKIRKKWGWSRGITELLCVNLFLAWSPWEGSTLLPCLPPTPLIFLLPLWADLELR